MKNLVLMMALLYWMSADGKNWYQYNQKGFVKLEAQARKHHHEAYVSVENGMWSVSNYPMFCIGISLPITFDNKFLKF